MDILQLVKIRCDEKVITTSFHRLVQAGIQIQKFSMPAFSGMTERSTALGNMASVEMG